MDISKRLVGECAKYSEKEEVIGVDFDALVRRLVLFDEFILRSIRLKEFPYLVRTLGINGLRELLESGVLKIQCERLVAAQIAQAKLNDQRMLPLLHFSFATVDATDREQFIHDCLKPLHGIEGPTHKEIIKLKKSIVSSLVRPPESIACDLRAQLRQDLQENPGLIKRAVQLDMGKPPVNKYARHEAKAREFFLHFVAIDDEGDFRAETDICEVTGMPKIVAHECIQASAFAVFRMNRRIAEMSAHSAISGFQDEEIDLFGHKLGFLLRQFSPAGQEQRFQHVLEISGLPALWAADKQPLDVTKLLKIRNSNECREFREWLSRVDSASDDEIKDRVASLNAKLANFAHAGVGKAMRFLAVLGLGLLPVIGGPLSAAASFIDSFLLEKILPRSGVVSFISRAYPSIFKNV